MTRTRLILTGIDLGPRSAAVLSRVRENAATDGARVAIVHCLDLRKVGEISESAGAMVAELDAILRQRQRGLERLVNEDLRRIRIHSSRVELGEPVEGLLKAISQLQPDLVVLGSGSRRLLPLRGVAEEVSRRSPVPVLLVPVSTQARDALSPPPASP